ncbi:MAG TPA: hypothetical protein VM123_04905 [archaeon]|nr:hypothetical protein [archaeon]
MLSLRTILNLARYEAKTLFRSWYFRSFAFLALVILGFVNFLFFTF